MVHNDGGVNISIVFAIVPFPGFTLDAADTDQNRRLGKPGAWIYLLELLFPVFGMDDQDSERLPIGGGWRYDSGFKHLR